MAQYHVNLSFSADASKAKAQLKDLQNQLTNLINTPQSKLGIEGEINNAIKAAAELRAHLQAATNVKTGNLDFSKLSQSLKQSNTTLTQYATKLQQLGPAGQQAFMTLAQSVAQAEIPIRRSSAALDKMWETLKNTARWQVSSTVLHGFMGAVQSAYGYAQDLNKSLNDIRIVTGQNTDQMAKFAKEANLAAKTLSTSTTNYTKASLIYYQQGLSDQEVKDRTDITVKMANVTRTSAEDVSDQLTAVWNNFYDGSKSLEHYADVMTALGAATASSTDEISEGLNKFAAVAETVGLSYEYAASALATVTATTRESADVVGNAFKTLFARIQGLKLGETLDDGTTLNKYSQALDAVGIKIKGTNGEMKDMDAILNELGAKWNTLGKDQQIALAQTVAGVRQYTQLIALMDNWDYFQENLNTANTSTGALQEQADIYADSWEAASKRVEAAAQSIYEKLMNDDFFIDLLNAFEKILTFVDHLIDGLGGLRGVLLTLGSIMTKVFADKMSQGLSTLAYNIRMSTPKGKQDAQLEREQVLTDMSNRFQGSDTEKENFKTYIGLQNRLTQLAEKMSQEELFANQQLLDRYKILTDIVSAKEKEVQLAERSLTLAEEEADEALEDATYTYEKKVDASLEASLKLPRYKKPSKAQKLIDTTEASKQEQIANATQSMASYKAGLKMQVDLPKITPLIKSSSAKDFDALRKRIEAVDKSLVGYVDTMRSAEEGSDDYKAAQKALTKGINASVRANRDALETFGVKTEVLQKLASKTRGVKAAYVELDDAQEDVTKGAEAVNESFDSNEKQQTHWANNFVSVAGAITAISGVVSSVIGIIEVWNNQDMSFGEKLITTFSTLAMIIPTLITSFTGLRLQQLAGAAAAISHALGLSTEAVATQVAAGATVSFGAALWSVLWPIGLVMLALAALIAVVWLVVKGVQAICDAYNKDAIAAKEAAERAKELAEAYNEVKQAYEDLKQSLADYQNAQNAIDELKKGTDEWREAIQDANEQVMQLVETYPELAAYVSNENGRLIISDEGMKVVKEQYAQRTNALYNMSLDANLDAKRAQNKATRTSMVRNELDTFSDVGVGFMWAASPLLGTIGQIANEVQADKSEVALEKLSQAYAEEGNAIFNDFDKTLQDLEITDPALIEALQENKDAVKELVEAEKQALDYEKLIAQQKVDNLLLSQGFTSEHYNANIQDLARKKYEQEVANKKATDYNIDDWTYQKWYTLGIATGGTDEGERVAKEYANLMGYEDFDVTNFKGDKIKFEHTVDGETKKGEITYEAMQRALAENAVGSEKAILQYTQRLTNAIVSLENVGTKEADSLAAFLEEGNLSYVDPEALEELKNGNLQAIFPSGTDVEQVARDFGYESIQALQDAIANAPYDAEQALANIARRTAEEVNAIFQENAAALDTTTDALEAYAAHLIATNDGLEENKKMAAVAAVEHFKLAKSLNNLQKVFEENVEILEEADENSIDYYEALGKVAQAVEETFGLDVSAEFIKENLEDIKKMAEGDEEALARLRKEVNKDFILHLNISDDNRKALEREMDYLSDIAENADIGTQLKLDNSAAIAAINEALYTGEATIDDIEAMFNNANLQMPEYHTTTVPGDAVTSHSTTHFEGPLGIKWTAKSDTTTTTDRVIPYFGDAAPTVDDSGFVNYGNSNSIAVTSTGNLNSLGSSLDYNGGEGDEDKKELDRYHYISKTLEDVERQYDAIADARERAFGADKLALYDTEIAKAKEVRDVLQRYADEAFEYYDKDQKALLNEPYGIVLDENGNIGNYDEVFANFGQDEKFQELVSNYEDSLTTWKEKLQEVIDKNNELLDLSLEKIQYKIDLAVKIDDQDQEYLDFLMEMADDPLTNAAEKLGYLTDKMNSSTKVAEQMGKSLREALRETGWNEADIDSILKGENIEELLASNKLTETQIEMIEQYRDQLYTTTQMLMTWADDIKDTVIEAFDEMGKAYDESANKLEHYNKILTTYENIIGLVGKDTLGISDSVFGELTQAQVDNAVNLLRVHKEAYETDKAALQQLRDSYNESWTDEAKEAWNEAVKHAEEKVRESEATMFDSWESALQAAADAFEKAVETAVKAYEKAMSGIHGSFDAMQTAYDRQTTLNERYLEDYEKIYELSKLNRQVANSIDDTDNVKSKKILKELQDEILELSESEAEVSEYQIGHLQKEYELKMALIALEEAQNAKSQVRMQRDSEGNWSYVYTADEAKVDDAQQNYEDKLFALQEYTQEYIQTNSDALMQLQQEYADAMANIKRENYATQEEYEAALAETTAFYEQMMNYHIGEIGLATTDAQKLYEQDWAKYSEMTGYKLGDDDKWISSWQETAVALTTGLGSVQDYQDAFKIASEQMISALSGAYGTWKDNVDTAMDAAGTATDKFAGKVEADTEAIQEDSEKLISYLDDIGEAARGAFKGVVDAAANNYSTYSKTVADYITENQKLIASLNEVIKKKAEVANQNTTNVTGNNTGDLSAQGDTGNQSPYGDDVEEPVAPPSTYPARNDGADTSQYTISDIDPPFEEGDAVTGAVDKLKPYAMNGSQLWYVKTSSVTGKQTVKRVTTVNGIRYYDLGWTYKGLAMGSGDPKENTSTPYATQPIWFMERDLKKFDTGGYTGSWGSNGRLAMLHQKELVLNADDTSNMLQAIEIVRKIARVIDLNAANAANAFGMLTATTATANDQIVEQEVIIHAEFPNATNHTEIEEAFNSLINRASQFANRKK